MDDRALDGSVATHEGIGLTRDPGEPAAARDPGSTTPATRDVNIAGPEPGTSSAVLVSSKTRKRPLSNSDKIMSDHKKVNTQTELLSDVSVHSQQSKKDINLNMFNHDTTMALSNNKHVIGLSETAQHRQFYSEKLFWV